MLVSLTAAACAAQQVDPEKLLASVQTKVLSGADRLSRYVCRQKITRRVYYPSRGKGGNCTAILAAASKNPTHGMRLVSWDRARLDVMLTSTSEMFSWPGAQRFDVEDPSKLLGTSKLSSSGDFGALLASLFAARAGRIHFDGMAEGGLARFTYQVPRSSSQFTLKGLHGESVVPWHGSFDVDPASADLVRLDDIVSEMPAGSQGCELRQEIYYARTAGSSSMLPLSSEVDEIATTGGYAENKTSYEGCHQYSAEAVLKFDDDDAPEAAPAVPTGKPPVPPAPGTLFRIRLTSPVDSEKNWAGDRIGGVLVEPVREKENGLIPAGTIFRGRVTQLEHDAYPDEGVVIGIRYDAIVLSGVELPVALVRSDVAGTGVYAFAGRKSGVLEKGIVSQWRIRTKDDDFMLLNPQ